MKFFSKTGYSVTNCLYLDRTSILKEEVKAMQDTMANIKEPLIVTDDCCTKVKTTQGTSFTKNEPLITLDDLAAHEEKRLMRTFLIMVIVVNLLVLISIILYS